MYKIGYTQGVFDMFHIGHLNLINGAAAQCEQLIVGVNSDELVQQYKDKKVVIPEKDRAEIIGNLKAVDRVEIVDTLDKVELYQKFHFDAVFIGDDWKGNERWLQTEKDLKEYGVDVVYLPHTPSVSSTGLRVEIPNRVEE
ncbi:MAG: glycerol-3-phosphate cytidylyltransferase [Lachnospiraceae bacterium]|jgi:glycerol-3-phosphate cytidylyltransferase|nr:glycerol-3-phosphate cytidylyltransferase [Lachnospiraceae bacterium]